ncbi:MAG: uncharacterized protein JWQ26_2426 [Modestobacter sp.]|jgi:hypothetical protein|nr:uncharacterized protein [Modestobacter sp.]
MIMHAEVGNWLVIRSRILDVPVRLGQIVEVSRPDGGPPYVVRWSDDDRTSVVFPGPDAVVMDDPPATAVGPRSG